MDDYSKNNQLQTRKINEDSFIFELNAPNGNGKVYAHKIFNGMHIMGINIESEIWPYMKMKFPRKVLNIHYCIDGRCEVVLDTSKSLCLSKNQICLCEYIAIKDFFYPTKYYKGVQIYIDLAEFEETSNFLIKEFNLDIKKIADDYSSNEETLISMISTELKIELEKIFKLANNQDIFAMKMSVLNMFKMLSLKNSPLENIKSNYLTSYQLKIAKLTKEILTENLQYKIKIADIASKFKVSPTTIKNYFKALYGESISEYMRKIRMKEASILIKTTNKPISVISNEVGYENQSKFASVYKSVYDISPIEDRRLTNIKS